MLFGPDERPRVLAGEVALVHRRWGSQLVCPGRTYRTNLGRIVIDTVDQLDADAITDADALAAGKPSAEQVRAHLRGAPEWPAFRIEFHLADDPDPSFPSANVAGCRPDETGSSGKSPSAQGARDDLARRADLTDDELADLHTRLARLDRVSPHGPWTRTTLELIAAKLATRAADLAAHLDREMAPFKLDVRKLKNLGLTYSLKVGYRLVPRGETYLRWSS